MNSTYFLYLTLGAVLCTELFAWRLNRREMKLSAALVALPLAAVLGLAASKAGYFLLQLRNQLAKYPGVNGLFTDTPKEFSFVCGCLGVVLAVVLAARITRQKALPILDAFAPCGALMAAITRACEGLLDPMVMIGLGEAVENEAHCIFPLAMENKNLYCWFYTIFMLEAALALICAIVSLSVSHKGRFAPGRVFFHTAFFLALPQIFVERMLNQCMRWGFVRVEQMMCALVVLAVILYACVKCKTRWAYLPVAMVFLCAGGIIWLEFTLDNKAPFGLDLPPTTCYVLMILILGCMAGLSLYSYHRLNKVNRK